MKIISIRRAPPGGNTLARFDLETDDGMRIRDLKLVEGQGGWRVYGPKHHGLSLITFPAAVVDRIATEALRHVRTAT
jgi:DNA-binding cell septation regulator SpoVG